MLLENYLKKRNQRVVLNGLNSSWKKNTSRGSTGLSFRSTFLPHIYINYLAHDISSVCKIFADDTSLFSKVKDTRLSFSDLNYDLEKINQWAHQWKMSFIPYPCSKKQKCYFLAK